jgi:hypothetical protein
MTNADGASAYYVATDVEGDPSDRIKRAMALIQRVLNHQVSIGALIELSVWLAIPRLSVGLVWSVFHSGQVQQIQTRLEKVMPAGADIGAFGLTAASWPASIQIADACPSN